MGESECVEQHVKLCVSVYMSLVSHCIDEQVHSGLCLWNLRFTFGSVFHVRRQYVAAVPARVALVPPVFQRMRLFVAVAHCQIYSGLANLRWVACGPRLIALKLSDTKRRHLLLDLTITNCSVRERVPW